MRLPRKNRFTLLGCLLLFMGLVYASYRMTTLNEHILKPVFFVTQDTGSLTPQQAMQQIRREVATVQNGFFNPGFTKTIWWLYLPAPIQRNLYLQIANPHINQIRMYEMEAAEWNEVYHSGDFYPYSPRILDDPDFWYPLSMSPNGLLIRVDKKGESLQVPLRLVPERELPGYLSDQKLLFGIFLGWFLFLVMLNLFLWGSLKDNIHLFYILYLTASGMWIFCNWGLGFRYLWPEAMEFSTKSRPIFANLSFLFMLELCKRFFTLPDQKPLYQKSIAALQGLLIFFTAALWLMNTNKVGTAVRYTYLTGTNLLWLASMVLILLYIRKNYRIQKVLTLFFLSAISILTLFIVIILFSQYSGGADWVFFVNKYGSALGLLAESTVLSFGLTQRYNQYKQEKEMAHQALEKAKMEVADKVIQTQEEERHRLARELHDGLGGLLGGIRISGHHKLGNHVAEQQWLGEQLDQAINDLRNIAHDLMPVNLQELGLSTILEKTISRWNMGDDFIVRLNSELENRYPLAIEAGIYRIVSELMHNIKKHAAATEVYIGLWEDKKTDHLTLLVEDNGIGFDPDKGEGLGWKNIRYRVEYMNGKVAIDSNTKGTTIIIEIPLLHERE